MKFKNLEGLRGLAALIVVLFHFFNNFYPALINASPKQVHTYNSIELKIAVSPLSILYNGSFAVYIFFVLSGFVLSYKFFKTGDNQVITASATRRYIRLMIPVLFSVLCFYTLYMMKLSWIVNSIPNFSLINALKESVYNSFFIGASTYNSVLWTMHFEFFGSFLVFGFCLIFGNMRNRMWCYVLAISIFWNTPYLAFILGMLISDAHNNNFVLNNKTGKILLFCLILFLGSYPNGIGIAPESVGINDTIYSFLHFTNNAVVVVHTLGAALLVFLLLNSVRFSNILSNSFFQFLGRISFSMYLTHALTIIFLSHLLFDYLHVNIGINYKLSFVVTLTISLMTIFIFSYLMEKYVDRNAVRFSGFVYNRFFTKPKIVSVKVITDRSIAQPRNS